MSHKDFVVAQATGEGEALHLRAGSEQGLRIIAIDVPENPGYACTVSKTSFQCTSTPQSTRIGGVCYSALLQLYSPRSNPTHFTSTHLLSPLSTLVFQ